MENGGIFISYRRCDGSGNPRDHALFVEILSHELADHFGVENVFINTSTSTADGYPDELQTKLAQCDVLLVVIHPEWLNDLRKQQDKTTNENFDRIHYEISTTLHGDLHFSGRPARRPEVIPILLEKTDPPKPIELPEDIRELALLQAFRLRFGSLTSDLTRLLTELEIHTATRWPLSPPLLSPPDPKTQDSVSEISRRTIPGPLASRGVAAAAFTIIFLQFAPAEQSEWTSPTFLLFWSTAVILGTLLGVAATAIFGRSLHQMEHYLHSLPAAWFLVIRLAFCTMATIMLMPAINKFDETHFLSLIVGVAGSVILIIYIVLVTIREFHGDSGWPPQPSLRAMTLRRTIVRLEHHLVTLWYPPLSRIQREQIWMIVHQLDTAVATLRKAADGTRTRLSWLRLCRTRLAAGYAVWLATTLSLSVASMYESSVRHDFPDWYCYLAVPIGVVACGFGIGTIELMFRNDRKMRSWFIEEIEKNRESRLLRHIPAHLTGKL